VTSEGALGFVVPDTNKTSGYTLDHGGAKTEPSTDSTLVFQLFSSPPPTIQSPTKQKQHKKFKNFIFLSLYIFKKKHQQQHYYKKDTKEFILDGVKGGLKEQAISNLGSMMTILQNPGS